MTVTSAFLGLSVLTWYHKSEDLIKEVDRETLTPSDFTLEIWNIPEGASKDDIANLCIKILDESYIGYNIREKHVMEVNFA